MVHRPGPRRLRIAVLLGLITACLAVPAAALDFGVVRHDAAIMTSAAAPLRQAVILAPAPNGGSVGSDADAYRDLLRRLGFEVTTIVADNRAELDGGLRRFVATVGRDGDVVVLVLGTAIAQGRDLYVMPTADGSSRQPDTGGVRLGDALGRILARAPKDLVAIVDLCRGADPATDCRQTPAALPDGTSGLVAYRVRSGGDAPMARTDTLRGDLMPLMRQPGLTALALYGALKGKLAGTDMGVAATSALSRNFSFLPVDFLARLPTRCNEAHATADGDALRGRSLGGLVTACEEATRTYGFSPYFADKLALVREQVEFEEAVESCSTPAPANMFLQSHPGSPLRGSVERFEAACEDARRRDEATREDAARQEAARQEAARQEAARQDDVAREEAARQEAARLEEAARQDAARRTLVPRGDLQPSFSCDGSLREPVAQLICADADLAVADFRLGQAYRRALELAVDRRALARDERDWLLRRDETCGIPTSGVFDPQELARFKPCLLEQIVARTQALGS